MSTARIAHHSDRGPRENLEDSVHAAVLEVCGATRQRIPIAMLLDGAGGHNAGEVASLCGMRRAVSILAGALASWAAGTPERMTSANISRLLIHALRKANAAVVQASAERPEHRDMATTAVCFVVWANTLHVAWAGDSRCYVWRKGRIHRLTRDHTAVQKMIDQRAIAPEEARTHPLAHVIDQYLGMTAGFEPGASTFSLKAGDLVLLCSDGLTDVMTDSELADTMAGQIEDGVNGLPRCLVAEALARGTAPTTRTSSVSDRLSR
jgi:serine/threonine protein phosphatase PrpC